jgi:sialate O-acetylesterase
MTLIETRGEGGLFLCAPTAGYGLIQGDLRTPPVLTEASRPGRASDGRLGAERVLAAPRRRNAPVWPTALVAFDHVGGGLVARGGGPLKGFAVAGADRVFSNAEARIEGGEVRVSCATVPAPVAVRYAWASNPAAANLGNAEGLPAGPFRTDNWPGITAGRK